MHLHIVYDYFYATTIPSWIVLATWPTKSKIFTLTLYKKFSHAWYALVKTTKHSCVFCDVVTLSKFKTVYLIICILQPPM